MFKGLNLDEIKRKLITMDESEEPNPTIKKKCSHNDLTIYVTGYVDSEYSYRTGEYSDYIQRYWIVVNSDGICVSRHVKYWAAKRFIGLTTERIPKAPRVTDAHALEVFKTTKDSALYRIDRGNCAPTAITNICNFSYAAVREVCKRHGFNPEKGGMWTHRIYSALKELGIKYETVTEEVRSVGKTLKTFDAANHPGTYIILVRGHCTSSINGTILDSRWNRNDRIQEDTRIIS